MLTFTVDVINPVRFAKSYVTASFDVILLAFIPPVLPDVNPDKNDFKSKSSCDANRVPAGN